VNTLNAMGAQPGVHEKNGRNQADEQQTETGSEKPPCTCHDGNLLSLSTSVHAEEVSGLIASCLDKSTPATMAGNKWLTFRMRNGISLSYSLSDIIVLFIRWLVKFSDLYI
jgi:hypothetical protein